MKPALPDGPLIHSENSEELNSCLNFPIPQYLTRFPLAANFVNPPTLLKSLRLGNRPRHDEPSCSQSSPAPDGSPPRRPPARILVLPPRLRRHHPFRPFRPTLPPPENPPIPFAKICKNPSKIHSRQPSSTPIFFRPLRPSPACHRTLPATENSPGGFGVPGGHGTRKACLRSQYGEFPL